MKDFTAAQWREIVAYFNGYCGYCNQPMEKATREHMLPLARGGDHTANNIIACCLSCNDRKGTKTLIEWLM